MSGNVCASWDVLSQRERDLSYDNVAAVPGCKELNAARIEASAVFRSANAGVLDLSYGPGARNAWDLYPAERADAPCLVFIHGGYWQWNRREDFACLAEGVCAQGWACAMPGYSLAPEVPLAGIVAEIGAALDWLQANGPAHGIAGKIVVSGWSAGGHLAALMLGHEAVSAGLAISGLFELGPLRDTYLNAALRLTDEEIITCSPLRLPAVNKPLAIAYGTSELPRMVHDSRALHARRAAQHAPGPLLPLVGLDHFTVLHELRGPNGALVRLAKSLLD